MTDRLRKACHDLLAGFAEMEDPPTGDLVDDVRDALADADVLSGQPDQYAQLHPTSRADIRSTENLCISCACQPACVVAQLQPAHLEVVVSRCLGFIEAPQEEEG